MMKAMICTKYKSRSALKLASLKKPRLAADEVLIKVIAASLQTADWRVQSLQMPLGMGLLARLFLGITKPRCQILGTEVAGIVEDVGYSVTEFKPGDAVIAALGANFGGHAEFVKIKESGAIAHKPAAMTFQEAACVSFGGLTALDFLKHRAKVKLHEHVLINGASGAVGSAAIQIARSLGAEVTAVCSRENFDLARSLGATHMIDYREESFWELPKKYDVVFDLMNTFTLGQGLRSLRRGGRLVLISAGLPQMIGGSVVAALAHKHFICGVTVDSKELLQELLALVVSGCYRGVVDKEYGLEQISQAYEYLEERHKRGSVVLNVWTPERLRDWLKEHPTTDA